MLVDSAGSLVEVGVIGILIGAMMEGATVVATVGTIVGVSVTPVGAAGDGV